jgi:integration host factor subunit beta
MNLKYYKSKGEIVNRSDLIEALSKDKDLTLTKAEKVVNTVFNTMANALVEGDRVEIRGLCSMFVKQYMAYSGKNPKTGRPIEVKPKKLPFFKCGKELKERVDTYK